MENFDLLSNDLQVTPQAQSYLVESAKWGKFLAIMGFILSGFIILFSFAAPALLNQMPQTSQLPLAYAAGFRAGIIIMYVVLALLLFFPCLYLYKFSVKMQLSVKDTSQENFDESLMNLKSVFKFYGIFTIVTMSVYALIFISGIIMAVMHS